MGHITHHPLYFVATPRTIEMIVVIRHIETKTAPIAKRLPPARTMRYIKNPINEISINHLNHFVGKNFGKDLFLLAFDRTISKKAPLGHKCPHQYLPLKADRVRKKIIMARTI